MINPIKVDYPFIDLLKPESEALFALLLALAPDCRRRLGSLSWVLRRVPLRKALAGPGRPAFRREIGSTLEDPAVGTFRKRKRCKTCSRRPCRRRRSQLFDVEPSVRREISGAGARAVLEGLVLGRRWGWERRITQLRAAISVLAHDESFSREVETGKGYRDAAAELAQRGERFTHVVFGHTHQVKDLALEGGGRYFNSGAWADRIRFPRTILSPDLEQSREAVEELLINCATASLDGYIEFEPGCVHIEVGDTTSARFRAYDAKADRLEA